MITVAFIGYLVAGVAGATLAAIGIFLPVYFFTIVPAPWFKRHRDHQRFVPLPPARPPPRAARSQARSSCSAAARLSTVPPRSLPASA